MCINPLKTYNRLNMGVEVPCRKCWQCKNDRIDDFVGRCIAEKENCEAVAVTLTYAPDCEVAAHASTLVYADIQKLLKRLRRKGHVVRYVFCGEYGEQKGRAHWHGILFFKNGLPNIEFETRFDWEFWPHGFSWFRKADHVGIRYALKYAIKSDEGANSIHAVRMSKKPVLGADYFDGLAARYVEAGLAPHNFEYRFPDVLDSKGKMKRFRMVGATREYFLESYRRQWLERWPDRPIPISDKLDVLDENKKRRARTYHEKRDAKSRFRGASYVGTDFLPTQWQIDAKEPVNVEFMECVQITGYVRDRVVTIFKWSDGSVTYKGRKFQWHLLGKDAKRYLRRIRQKEVEQLGELPRPKIMPLKTPLEKDA